MPARGPVVLLTDFADGYYQGVMRGVILSRAPGATVADLCHHVRPGAVAEAAYILRSALPYFPTTSVFLCVVDPGVGGARRRILVEHPAGPLIVAPDNGLAAAVVAGAPAAVVREITNAAFFLGEECATFEGRSHFAPAAAALAAGAAPSSAGPVVRDAVMPDWHVCTRDGDSLRTTVAYVDPFGNLVTSADAAALDALGPRTALQVDVGPAVVRGVVRTYADAPKDALLAYVGSTGHLEIGVRDGDAAARLHVRAGAPVRVRRAEAR